MSTKQILRRVIWNFYAIPMTLLLLPSDFMAIYQYGPGMFPYATLDFLICLPALLAMHLNIWDKQLFAPAFWKTYAFVYIAWDFSFNILIQPAITHEEFDPRLLIFPVVCLPLYISVFRYAFRKWSPPVTPREGVQIESHTGP